MLPRFKSVTGKIMKKCFPFFGLRAVPQKTLGHYWLPTQIYR